MKFICLSLALAGLIFVPSSHSLAANPPSAWESPDGLAAGRFYFGYTWPFEGRDLNAEIGDTPVLLELFSDPGCMYCPPADQFLNDLIKKTNVIALSCHINSLMIVRDDPLTLTQCRDRQVFYSAMLREPRITPQIFVNGRNPIKGYLHKKVLKEILRKDVPPPQKLDIVAAPNKLKGHARQYSIQLSAMTFGAIKDFNDRGYVTLIEYKKPVTTTISTGPNEGLTSEYLHVVSRILPLADWMGEEVAYKFEWQPEKDSAGAVIVFERKDTGLFALGEIKLTH
ncbi:MAG: DUF1223 domain-containing protein [Alphaproteobacteria bacterium]|nr:DUF1223 domain-containing protein [Alphaproteobacteria bacterium]MCB9985756.1 DUF1223 domain-containing protein [Micavibrio sp.]HPQ50568.1 DUF1223 domain-containing protein [Alphaproteobacteria bacterium]